MKTNEFLVNELDMNMDEAMELFSTETLDAMQMANVAGGAGWWTKAAEWVAGIAVGTIVESIYNDICSWFTEKGEPTPNPNEISIREGEWTFKGKADSIIIARPDGTIEKYYGVGTPTP